MNTGGTDHKARRGKLENGEQLHARQIIAG